LFESRVPRTIFGPRGIRKEESGGDCIMKNCPVILIKYYSGNQIKKNEMAGACDT
jgi:hypothetical protein